MTPQSNASFSPRGLTNVRRPARPHASNDQPPLHPEAAAYLARHGDETGPPTDGPDYVVETRRRLRAQEHPDPSRGGEYELRDLTIPANAEQPAVDVLVCRPAAARGDTAAMVFIHGGAFMFHDRFTGGLDLAQRWVAGLGLTIVSVEYRQPPEHPHPAPVLDCVRALTWLHDNAASLGVTASKIFVAGISAGAGLAAATVLANADGSGVPVRGALLHAPMLDDRCRTPSMNQITGSGLLTAPSVLVGWNALLETRAGGDVVSPYAAPARADRFDGLPPLFLEVGSVDVFRDETTAFATNVWAAGGDAELHVWPGVTHGFEALIPQSDVTATADGVRRRWLHHVLDRD